MVGRTKGKRIRHVSPYGGDPGRRRVLLSTKGCGGGRKRATSWFYEHNKTPRESLQQDGEDPAKHHSSISAAVTVIFRHG